MPDFEDFDPGPSQYQPTPEDAAVLRMLEQLNARDPADEDLALRFIKESRGTIVHCYDTFWRFDYSTWRELPLDVLQGELALFIGRTRHPDDVTPRRLRTIPAILQARLAAQPDEWNTDPNLLPCLNGLLNLTDREITIPKPEHRLLRICGTMYNPRAHIAVCPVWDAFIGSTFSPPEAEFLQEFAGLSLTFDNSHETAVWLHGPPGSGKSTFVRGLEIILGERAGVLNLASLARGRVSAADLLGRTLLISVEQPIADLQHDHLINALVSGEPIPVKTPYSHGAEGTARTTAKWLWALTSLPRVGFAGSGLFRRARIVTLPYRAAADRDPTLKAKFRGEATGILRWALAGLDRLRARGRFNLPPTVLAADERYRQSNDLIAQFLAESTEAHPNYRVQSSVLFSAYKTWCSSNGYIPRGQIAIAAELERHGYERRRSGGLFYWFGLQPISTGAAPDKPAQPGDDSPKRKNKKAKKGSPSSPSSPISRP